MTKNIVFASHSVDITSMLPLLVNQTYTNEVQHYCHRRITELKQTFYKDRLTQIISLLDNPHSPS